MGDRRTAGMIAAGVLSAGAALAGAAGPTTAPSVQSMPSEVTCFQVGAPYSPRIHIGADVAIVYGIDPSVTERLAGWKKAGYRTHVMTGVAWGNYQDYYYGRWDGVSHEDQAQTMANGEKIGHGGDVYYMSPGPDYGRYLCVGVKRAIDAGAEAIHLEEPEFWVRSGWEGNFRREWKQYYGEDWVAPDSSPEAQWRASKLKYFLYRRALGQVFDFVRDYSKQIGREVKCYVPTHSLLNYAHWCIVSPESSLIDVGCDGYIAQVWTGTSRTPNYYNGRKQERTFETAFLEYGAMQNLVRASGRRVWYLNDPVEDNPDHSWVDYRRNWESTLVASLLRPEVWHYEVMPWPDRIFTGKYPKNESDRQRVGIPKDYEVELQAVINAMERMKQQDVEWIECGTRNTGVLVSDTMMFQRAGPGASDPDLSSFYGLAMPLVKAGVPVEPVQMESIAGNKRATTRPTADANEVNATKADFLAPYRVLLLTYEGQKAMGPEANEGIARWVRNGGALVVVDADLDPFNKIREWWNIGENHFAGPREHLFKLLGLESDFAGLAHVGRGVVLRVKESPAKIAHERGGADKLRSWCKEAGEAVGVKWEESSALVLRRGPYVLAGNVSRQPQPLQGQFIDLFAPGLPRVSDPTLAAGERRLLIDLAHVEPGPRVLVASGKVDGEQAEPHRLAFDISGIAETQAVVRAKVPAQPSSVTVDGKALPPGEWRDGVLSVQFPNSAKAQHVEIEW